MIAASGPVLGSSSSSRLAHFYASMAVSYKMARWSDLPEHLLLLIARRVHTQIDILRLRAVCSSWRSSIPLPKFLLRPLPLKLPLPTSAADLQGFFALSSDIVYIIQPPVRRSGNLPEGWLVRVKEEKPGKLLPFSPVTNHRIVHFPETFTRELNLLDFRVTQARELFAVRFVDKRDVRSGDLRVPNSLKFWKVVLSGNLVTIEAPDCVAFAIFGKGRLCFWKPGAANWTFLNVDQDVQFCDIAIRHEKLYAINVDGGLLVLDSSMEVVRAIKSPLGDDTASVALYLVESFGELLLLVFHGIAFCDKQRYVDRLRGYRTLNDPNLKKLVDVFSLDETELGWIKVYDLGDRALFVNDLGSWAISTDEFSGCKRNCIYYGCSSSTKLAQCDLRLEGLDYEHMGVFNLEYGRGVPLASCPEYAKMFWPPPPWLTTTMKFHTGECSTSTPK